MIYKRTLGIEPHMGPRKRTLMVCDAKTRRIHLQETTKEQNPSCVRGGKTKSPPLRHCTLHPLIHKPHEHILNAYPAPPLPAASLPPKGKNITSDTIAMHYSTLIQNLYTSRKTSSAHHWLTWQTCGLTGTITVPQTDSLTINESPMRDQQKEAAALTREPVDTKTEHINILFNRRKEKIP